ncbi:MAG: hypothetical protein PSV35_00735 [bacterium]|nr:hypothetical protein [bacterium]
MLTISVGQALLILIKNNKNNVPVCEQLKKLYLSGISRPQDLEFIQKTFASAKKDVLKDYDISYDGTVTSIDPVRRYFETHLAYETLKNGLHQLPDIFEAYTAKVYMDALYFAGKDQDITDRIDHVLKGKAEDNEFSLYIRNINLLPDGDFNSKDKRKLIRLLQLAYLIVKIASLSFLPLDIYFAGFYCYEHRGRTRKKENDHSLSCHKGVMASYMPVPRGDIATTEQSSMHRRTTEKYHCISNAAWSQHNVSLLVHPFVASISGYILCQLRYMKLVSQYQPNEFTKLFGTDTQIISYFKVFIASFLYQSGGHSLYELTAPFQLAEIRTAFSFVTDFDTIDLYRLFYKNNEVAFDKALQDTLSYQEVYLKKSALLQSLRTNNKPLKKIASSNQWRFFSLSEVVEESVSRVVQIPMFG